MTGAEPYPVSGRAGGLDRDLEAAEWLVRLENVGIGERRDLEAACDRWRQSDAGNNAAFERLSKTWDAVGEFRDAPEIAALRHDARQVLIARRRKQSRARTVRWALFGAADVSAIAAAFVAFVFYWQPAAQLFTTGIGETKTVRLSDGSQMELDADSSASVAFDRDARLVRVLKGQAYFEVAKHQQRPFIVVCHERAVVATGTAFDVESIPDGLQVTLAEGHVVVHASSGLQGPVVARLEPGDTLTTTEDSPAQLQHQTNLLELLAWRTGHLMFDNATLGEATSRMSRYVHQRIEIDPSLAGLRISGVFAAGNMRGMIEAVEAYYPVRDVPAGSGAIRLEHR